MPPGPALQLTEVAQGHRSASGHVTQGPALFLSGLAQELAEFLSEQHHGDLLQPVTTCVRVTLPACTDIQHPRHQQQGAAHTLPADAVAVAGEQHRFHLDLPAPGPVTARWTVPTGIPSWGSGPATLWWRPRYLRHNERALRQPWRWPRRDRRRHAQPAGPRAPRAARPLRSVAYATIPPRTTSDAPGTSTRAAHTRPPVRGLRRRDGQALVTQGEDDLPGDRRLGHDPPCPARRARFMADRSLVCRRRRASMT